MYLRDASVRAVSAAVSKLEPTPSECLAILLAADDNPDVSSLVSALRKLRRPFIGAVVPRLIEGSTLHASGAIVDHFPCISPPFAVTGLDRDSFELPPAAAKIAEQEHPSATALILADGLAQSISSFVAELASLLGNTISYVGGGAGFPDLRRAHCLFTSEDGPLMNAAIVAVSPMQSSLGVRHGWKRLVGPVVATRTERNVIYELNWRNAFEVYSEIVSEDSGTKLTAATFPKTSIRYPFGIIKEGAEDVVRDPIALTPAGGLVCVGEIPENAALSILRGDPDALIAAAGHASAEALGNAAEPPYRAMVIDCVSRYAFLGPRFGEELAAVVNAIPAGARERMSIQGFLSLGEISSHGEGLVDFLNKTIVVGALHD